MANPYDPNQNDPIQAQQDFLAQQYAAQIAAYQNMLPVSELMNQYTAYNHQGFDPNAFQSYIPNPGNPQEQQLTQAYYDSIVNQPTGSSSSSVSLLDQAQNQASAYAQMKAQAEFTQQMAQLEQQKLQQRQDLLFKLQDALSQEMAQGTPRATAYGQVASVLAAARAGGIDVADSDGMAILNALYPSEGDQGPSSLYVNNAPNPLTGPILSKTWAATYGNPNWNTKKGLDAETTSAIIGSLLSDPNVAAQVMTPSGGGMQGLRAAVQGAFGQFKMATQNTQAPASGNGGGLPLWAVPAGLGAITAGRNVARVATGKAPTASVRAAARAGSWAAEKAGGALGDLAGAARSFIAPMNQGSFLPNEWLAQAEPSAAEGYRGVGGPLLQQLQAQRLGAASLETGMPPAEAAGFAGQVRPLGMGASPTYTEGIPSLGVLRSLIYGMGEPGAMMLPSAPLPRISGAGVPMSGELAPMIGEVAGIGTPGMYGSGLGGSPLFGLLGGHIYTER